MTRNTFVLKIQRELSHPKSFGSFEKRAPGLLELLFLSLQIWEWLAVWKNLFLGFPDVWSIYVDFTLICGVLMDASEPIARGGPWQTREISLLACYGSRAHALTLSWIPEGFLTLTKKTDECRSGIFSVNFHFRDKNSTIIAMILCFVIFSVFCGRIARGKELGNEINKA